MTLPQVTMLRQACPGITESLATPLHDTSTRQFFCFFLFGILLLIHRSTCETKTDLTCNMILMILILVVNFIYEAKAFCSMGVVQSDTNHTPRYLSKLFSSPFVGQRVNQESHQICSTNMIMGCYILKYHCPPSPPYYMTAPRIVGILFLVFVLVYRYRLFRCIMYHCMLIIQVQLTRSSTSDSLINDDESLQM